MMPKLNASNAVAALLCAALLLLPAYSAVTGNIFILTLFTRIVIFALAAASLSTATFDIDDGARMPYHWVISNPG